MLTLLRIAHEEGRTQGEETTMAMVHEPRHQRGVCTPQGNALCFGVALGGLVLLAMLFSWLLSLVDLLL